MGEKLLWKGCSDGKVEDVRTLLQNSHTNTNWQDSELLRTPLYIACQNGHVGIVKLLLNEARVDLNKGNKNDATPFFIACQQGHIGIVKLLLNNEKVDINKPTNEGCTPFYVACSFGQIEIVELLLNDNRVDINKALNSGGTPFYIVCQFGYIDIVKLLVKDKRIDINKAKNDGATPFYIACQFGYLDIVKCLLESGREIDINKKWNNTKTPLDISKERSNSTQKFSWETEEQFQKVKRNCLKIAELIESFQRNQVETGPKLKKELESTYDIEHNGKFYILKTTSKTLPELESDIRSKFKLQGNTEFDLEFVRNGRYFVLEDIEDLKEGMTIKISVSTVSIQPQQNVNRIDDISNLKISSPSSKPSVFLTHTWVKDELNRDNHARVATVNKFLKAQEFKTWFDDDKMVGHIYQKMAEGIDDSDIILVFITKTYMEKLNSKGHDNCKDEFTYAVSQKKKMIPIVMEPCMRDQIQWVGLLGFKLGAYLYVDMSETDSEFNIIALIESLNKTWSQQK